MNIAPPTVSVTDEVLDFLATAPTQEQILDFKASEELQLRLCNIS